MNRIIKLFNYFFTKKDNSISIENVAFEENKKNAQNKIT
jgi:hypothetical protein